MLYIIPRTDVPPSQKDTATESLSRIDPAIEDRASEADRAWFTARSGRRYRWRARLPGEMGGESPELGYVLVRQVRPGFRVRLPVGCTDAGGPPDSDAAIGRIAELLETDEVAAVTSGGRVVRLLELGGDRRYA